MGSDGGPMRNSAAVLVLGMTLSAILVHAQGIGSPQGKTDSAHRIPYVMTDGRPAEISVSSLTKFAAMIDSHVTRDQSAGMFVYEYAVHSGKTSVHRIGRMELTLNGSIRVSSPDGWDHDRRRTGLATWSAIEEGGRQAGIHPGDAKVGFRVESTFLPGITLARLRGVGPPPHIPLAAPAAVAEEVAQFTRRDVVGVPVIAPVIPREESEDAEGFAVLIVHVQQHFDAFLKGAGHPGAGTILKDLADASKAVRESRVDDARAALGRARSVTVTTAGGARHLEDVTAALTATLGYIESRLASSYR